MQGINKVYIRNLEEALRRAIAKKQSVIIFGPRQTGKTTLVKSCPSNPASAFRLSRNILPFSKTP
jgi:predicted AAA+ superfamily ATPase